MSLERNRLLVRGGKISGQAHGLFKRQKAESVPGNEEFAAPAAEFEIKHYVLREENHGGQEITGVQVRTRLA